MEELLLMKLCDHNQVAKTVEIFKEDVKSLSEIKLYIVREYKEGISLKEFAFSQKQRTEKQVANIITQILQIVKCMILKSKENIYSDDNPYNLISSKIYQRDFKIENFIIDPNTLDVQLIDIGFSSMFKNVVELKTYLSKPISLSPEAIKTKCKQCCAIWSIGVITYTLLEGKDPYEGKSTADLFHNIVNNKSPFYIEKWEHSEDSYDFIINMMSNIVAARMRLNQALNHSFLTITREDSDVKDQKFDIKNELEGKNPIVRIQTSTIEVQRMIEAAAKDQLANNDSLPFLIQESKEESSEGFEVPIDDINDMEHENTKEELIELMSPNQQEETVTSKSSLSILEVDNVEMSKTFAHDEYSTDLLNKSIECISKSAESVDEDYLRIKRYIDS